MGYAFQTTVTVPAPSASRTNFSFPLKGTDTKLRLQSLGTGGAIVNTDTRAYTSYNQTVPADLILSTDAAGASLMTWGIDYWDQVTGIIWMWVLIPSWTAGFTIYVSVGNPAITAFQGGSVGSEFNSNTKLRNHMGDSGGATLTDFTSLGNVGTKKGTTQPSTTTSGKIGEAQTFVGTASSANNDYVTFTPISVGTAYTILFWTKLTSSSLGIFDCMTLTDSSGSPLVGLMVGFGAGNRQVHYYNTFNGGYDTTNTTLLTVGTFVHVAFRRNGNTTTVFINGSPGTNGNITGTGSESIVSIGWPNGSSGTTNTLPTTTDEHIVYNVAQSDGWILDEYTTQNTVATMGTFNPILRGGGSGLLLFGVGM